MANDAPRKVWDNHQIIADVPRSSKMKIQVSLTSFKGIKFIVLREWYIKRGEEGPWKPGVNGMSIPIAMPVDGEEIHAALGVAKAILEAIGLSDSFPLDDPDNYVYMKEKSE